MFHLMLKSLLLGFYHYLEIYTFQIQALVIQLYFHVPNITGIIYIQ
jgi:hypothetical protein